MKVITKQTQFPYPISEALLEKWPDSIYLLDIHTKIPKDILPERCIGLCDNLSPENVISLCINTNIQHVVQTSNPDFENDIHVAASVITKNKMFFENPFSTLLGNVEPQFRYTLKASKQKETVMIAVRKHLESLPRSNTIKDSLMFIADELFTNALFNAPFGSLSKDQHIDRTAPIELPIEDYAELFIAENGKKILIGCIDPFGSLIPKKLFSMIHQCYEKGVLSSMRMGTGGAGIGSYFMFHMSTNFYVLVQEGTKTFVCCALPMGQSSKSKELIPKNLHFSLLKGEANVWDSNS